MWYAAPGVEPSIMNEGLPIGNGRLGALATGDSASDAFYLTDGSYWEGTANATLDSGGDGQFPYDTTDFGTFGQMATAYLGLPAHTASAISGYQRVLATVGSSPAAESAPGWYKLVSMANMLVVLAMIGLFTASLIDPGQRSAFDRHPRSARATEPRSRHRGRPRTSAFACAWRCDGSASRSRPSSATPTSHVCRSHARLGSPS